MESTAPSPTTSASTANPDASLLPAARPWIMAIVVTTIFTVLIFTFSDVRRLLWFKSLHIIAVVSWFAGIFYLPRLFVYHASVPEDEVASHERFCIMERKLYRFITPFMIMTVSFGFLMLWEYGREYFRTNLWIHHKITLVVLLLGYHGWMGYHGRAVRLGRRTRNHKFYRFVNELPVLILFAVVFLVVFKPT